MSPYLSPDAARRPKQGPAWLAAAAALALSACSTTGPQPPAAQPSPNAAAASPAAAAQPPARQPAPQPGAPQPAPQAPQAAAPNPALQALLARSDATLQLIESNRMDELWAATAPFVQATSPRAQFQEGVRRARAALGTVQGRQRGGVQPVQFGPDSKSPPPGQYVNVMYVAQLASGQRVAERLSFRQEGNAWLFTGYGTQLLQPQAAAAQSPSQAVPRPPAAAAPAPATRR
ncbi:DUF4019 domain-containing protein [Xenophilus sp. Marseille-Q4582]|uniref:DUF4019 domain-containing protein n=1 Tax=Xenophilus sp. Marseille-Q4582 TaxID=2866600 RepID=UPI001CE426E5|nr:DUF4019 domain-containing protein [Xenophilus sp. Marseille-Q4582]